METKNDKINKYHNGKIYTLRSYQTDKYYIGSTCDALHKRFYQHKQDFNRWNKWNKRYITSFEILKFDDCFIELLEVFKCESKNELRKREGELIRLHKNDVVNIKIDGQTKLEYWHSGYGQMRNEHRRNTKVKCEVCNKEIRKEGISEHEQAKKHIRNLLIKENEKNTL
jgi:hypothetical protein